MPDTPSALTLERFSAAFGVWDEVRPYVSLIVDEQEMRLVVAMQGGAITSEDAAASLGLEPEATADLLQRSYERCVLNRKLQDGVLSYTAADLYARLDQFVKYENWDDIPADERQIIDRRFLAEFMARHRAGIDHTLHGGDAEASATHLPNQDVLLLSEVEAMLDAATHIVVQPCDCRRLGQHCARPVETCLALDSVALEVLDRGHGRRLTAHEAKRLVRQADRKGLMHTADAGWQTSGLHTICNCCACDCYPFRAAVELGSKGIWPRSRYVAAYDREHCHFCGTCVRRCHFAAFYHDGTRVPVAGQLSATVVLDAARCWGCGLCANTCPSGAITMQPLP